MNSTGYYVRKGLRLSFNFYLKHFLTIFITLIIEITKLITLPLVFLTPVFNKMQFNFNKILIETNEAIYTKSFDDTDKNPAYLTRLIYFAVCFFVSIVSTTFLFGLFFGIFKLVGFVIERYADETIKENVGNGFNVAIIFIGVLCGVIALVCFVFSYVGGFICCASNELSLGDVFYNTLSTMKRYGVKILLATLLYILFIASYVFIFGLPLLILHALLVQKNVGLLITIYIIFGLVLGVGLIFIIPYFVTAYRLTMHLMLDKCADLTKKVVVVEKTKPDGNEQKTTVFPYEERARVEEVSLKKDKRKKELK